MMSGSQTTPEAALAGAGLERVHGGPGSRIDASAGSVADGVRRRACNAVFHRKGGGLRPTPALAVGGAGRYRSAAAVGGVAIGGDRRLASGGGAAGAGGGAGAAVGGMV